MSKISEIIVESQKEKDICAEIEKLRLQLLQERHSNETAQRYKFKRLASRCFIKFYEGELSTENIDFIKILEYKENYGFEVIIVSGKFDCVGTRNFYIQIRYMDPDEFYDLKVISNKKFENALKVVKMLMAGKVVQAEQWQRIWKGSLTS
jgi:hypothetical protein